MNGGKKLTGEISVKGAKNSALKILAATTLISGKSKIDNIPQINDIKKLLEIIEDLGAQIEKTSDNSLAISTDTINKTEIDNELGSSLRASIILAGPMLARFGKISIPYPGGCLIGKRPIDMFINGLQSFGATFEEKNGKYYFTSDRLKATNFMFPKISVTGTEAMMMAATLADGITVLKNSAQEPEIPALAKYLNNCGAKISGAGTSTITIEGVEK